MASQSELEFNKRRQIQICNIPPSTEGEIREFLIGVPIKGVKLNEPLDIATIDLTFGNQLENVVERLNGKRFKDNTVVVKPVLSNKLLGVAHIPQSYTDKKFRELCEQCGAITFAYVMRSHKPNLSKGYGLVEFSGDFDQVRAFKTELDWKEVDGQVLHADFVDQVVQMSYSAMQSRCLLVTGMPEDFIDVSKMRELFGCVTSPVYCQIIAKDEKSLGYGIVEYKTSEEAEETWVKMRNEKIEGNSVVLSFCIPGKSAVVINNRIIWKYGERLQKSSLLPDPATAAKPVIAGNPIVISLSKMNPKLMDEFSVVLCELQQAYVSQMMSPVNKPGLLGAAPSLPLSPMMNPNMQLGLLVMLAISIQTAKKEKFTGVLAKQLNTLSEQDTEPMSGPKPSILGDPMTGQANVILSSLKQQLNQVPVSGDDGKVLEEPVTLEDALKFIQKKFIANGRYLNLNLLSNLGQILVTMKQASGDFLGPSRAPGAGLLNTPTPPKGQSLLGPLPGVQGGMGLMGMSDGNKNLSLLGDAPGPAGVGGKGQSLMGAAPGKANNPAMGIGMSSGGSGMSSVSQTLLGQISHGLVHQIGQNLMYQLSVNQTPNVNNQSASNAKGLLGDVPQAGGNAGGSRNKPPASKNSLLGEPPNQLQSAQNQQTPLDQGSWKASDNRWGVGAGYESGYGNKSGMGGGYNDYSYGGDSYSQQDMGGVNYGGSGYNSGYGENDFYNSYHQYGSNNFGSGSGFGGGGNSMSGAGSSYGLSGGMSGNQASGVNFQDGQSFGKSGNSNGLGQDSGRYGGDGYGGGMNYNYSSGRDDYGDNGYDSYGSVGMGAGGGGLMNDNMGMSQGGGGNMSMGGMGGNMSGVGGGNMSGMGGGSMSGMGAGSMSGMGAGTMSGMGGGSMSGMGAGTMSGIAGGGMAGGSMSGMAGGSMSSMAGGSMGGGNMSGMGSSGGLGSVAASGAGMGGSSASMGMMGGNSSMSGTGGMGMGVYGGSYTSGSGMSSTATNLMGSMSGSGGMSDNYGSSASYSTGMGSGRGLMSGGGTSGSMSLMGSGYGSTTMTSSNKASGSGSMPAYGGRDQTQMGGSSSYYQSMGTSGGSTSTASGLLPAPGKYPSPAGQKRTYSQLLPNPEPSPEAPEYIGQHSQGLGGHYVESFKRTRLH